MWLLNIINSKIFMSVCLPQAGIAGKPKVYQGVRVKITVKELLQQRRARQAATGSAVSKNVVPWGSGSSSSIQFAEPVSPPHPEPFEAEPIPSVPSCCPSWQFSSCLSCEESPGYLEQLIDSCLQSDAPSEPAFSACQPSSHYTPDAFQPVQLCFNQGLAASSPSSADLPSPWNYSCSPPQLSPLTPLTPSPPSSLDTKPYSCPVEEWPCHPPCPFPSPACCCTACGSQNMDSRVPQCFPCPSTDCMEFLPPLAVAEDFFRRDRSCDICYS
ncbi:colorectal cancer-associated protein 2 isoform X1 [Corvus cornix cornix]|uniref:colorectal cancer-associated protein 2 isoform X1 n=1 Tax=Corvus cornix cornix TaxID=932674 RepID=UPI000900DC78|nr:colorectal cancer-associated protein 2 isoform X1 [Corvus cornix cornix]